MMSNKYDAGDVVRLLATFTVEGAPVEPTLVEVTVVRPDNITEPVTPVSDGAGAYHADIGPLPHVPGPWHYRWVGTGQGASSEGHAFTVRRSRVVEVAGG